jgi:hypothetical protein
MAMGVVVSTTVVVSTLATVPVEALYQYSCLCPPYYYWRVSIGRCRVMILIMVIIFIVRLGADDHIVIVIMTIMIMKIKPTPMMIVTMTNLIPCLPRHGNHKHSNNILDMIVTTAVQVTVPVCHHHRPCPCQEQATPPPNLPFRVLGEGRPNRLMYSSFCFVNGPGPVDCSDCHVFRLNWIA